MAVPVLSGVIILRNMLLYYFLIFLFGLSLGSFLNVVISRLGTKESIISGRSHCPRCGAILKWYELIPILSFVRQKGKCRNCGEKISWQYPLVELATGLISLFIINKYLIVNQELDFKNYAAIIYWLAIASFFIIIFVYDLKHYLIPDKIIYPAILLFFIWSLISFLMKDIQYIEIFKSFLTALGASLFFFSLVVISRGKGMGLGDVKLAFLMGLILSWPNILVALFLSFMSGALIGLLLIIFGKKSFKSQIPFGPFLTASTLFVLICYDYLIEKILAMNIFFI